MKNFLALFLISLLLTSCGVSINSVVDDSGDGHLYSNPLVVIPYGENGTEKFSHRLKDKIEVHFSADEKDVEVFAFERPEQSLSLNTQDRFAEKIQKAIVNGEKDLLLIIEPQNLYYNGGSLQVADYQLTGFDTKTGNEVWKANFRSRSYFGPAFFTKKTARIIYERLKTDKVL